MTPTRLALALALCFTPLVCSAYDGPIHFEAGLGASSFTPRGDGTWYQSAFPHKLNLTSPSVTAGFTGTLYVTGPYSLIYHLDYIFVGHVSSSALAVPNDADYSPSSHSCLANCSNLATFVGNGNDQGVVFSLQPTYTFPNGVAIGLEGGAYLHRSTFHETVYNWFTPGTTITASYHPRWQLAPMVGANVSWGNTTISYRYLMNASQWTSSNPYPSIWKGTHLLTIMERF